jgi:hypothetical protein
MSKCEICGKEMIKDMLGYYACWYYPSSFCNKNILRLNKIKKIIKKHDTQT